MLEPHFISIFFLIYCKSDSEKSLSPKEYSRISCLILNFKCMYAIKSFVWTAERCFFLAKRCFQGKPVHQRVFWPISVYQGKSMFFTLLTSTKGSQRNSFTPPTNNPHFWVVIILTHSLYDIGNKLFFLVLEGFYRQKFKNTILFPECWHQYIYRF